MSNVIGFKAYKNTLKRDSGYAPVSGENGYSVIRCVFPVGGDWDDISEVSAGFFVHPKDIAVVTGTIATGGEERAAEFTIPGALLKQGERLHFGLFATVNGVTIATNTVVLDVARGIVSDDIDYDPTEAANMFEQFSNALNTALLGKADKAAAGTDGELAALDANGALIRSGVLVEQSIGEGSNSRVPTTAAVKTALEGKADKLVNGDYAFTDRILIAGNDGGIKNSHYTINPASLSGDVNWTVPSSNVVANALAGKADKAAAGTNGELAAFDGNGALIRSGINVAPSVGAGSNTKVPTTAAVKLVLDGKADKAHTGDFGELAALDDNGALIRSGVSVTQGVGAGSNSTVPTTAAVKTALDGKADKLSGGGGGELVSATGGGEIQRSGFFVTQSIGSGAANMLPSTNAVRQHVFSMLDEALNGSDDGAPSLFVRLNTQTGKYQLVYEDSNDDLHVLFDFGLLHVPTKTSELTNDSGYIFPVCVGSIDACTQPMTLYYTVFENRHAYVFNTDTADSWMDGKKVYTDIIRVQYVFVDGKIRTRDRMYHDDTASWSEWSTWEEIGGGSQIVSGVVNQNGTITFTDSDGNTFTTSGASVIGPQGAPGDDYVLTAQDKTDIANIVLQLLPTTQGVLYGNEND